MLDVSIVNTRMYSWWAHQDLNLGPLGYEPIALTAELWAPLKYTGTERMEHGKQKQAA
jgi:hypothetical protein